MLNIGIFFKNLKNDNEIFRAIRSDDYACVAFRSLELCSIVVPPSVK